MAEFDMDGVITDTASIHATCWKTMFDAFLPQWSTRNAEPFRAFDVVTDYKLQVDGKPRYQGVRDFLSDCPQAYKTSHTEDFGQVVFTIAAQPQRPIRLTKYMVYYTSKAATPDAVCRRAEWTLDRVVGQGSP